jgi:hypothetical protein
MRADPGGTPRAEGVFPPVFPLDTLILVATMVVVVPVKDGGPVEGEWQLWRSIRYRSTDRGSRGSSELPRDLQPSDRRSGRASAVQNLAVSQGGCRAIAIHSSSRLCRARRVRVVMTAGNRARSSRRACPDGIDVRTSIDGQRE